MRAWKAPRGLGVCVGALAAMCLFLLMASGGIGILDAFLVRAEPGKPGDQDA